MRKPPPDIAVIWAKPGRAWTLDERDRVKTWLNSEPQLADMRAFALRHLGPTGTRQDAEDCWGDYNAKGELDKVIARYEPAKGMFPSYLYLCFKQYCWRWGQAEARQPLGRPRAEPPRDDDGESLEIVFVDDRSPADDAQRRERYAGLNDCIERLPPDFRIVVTLHYFEGYSVAEIANKEGISESLVKVRLFRARQELRKCLENKGIKP